jgi:hypothetical protein
MITKDPLRIRAGRFMKFLGMSRRVSARHFPEI